MKDYPAGIFLGQEFFEALSNKLFAADFLTPYVRSFLLCYRSRAYKFLVILYKKLEDFTNIKRVMQTKLKDFSEISMLLRLPASIALQKNPFYKQACTISNILRVGLVGSFVFTTLVVQHSEFLFYLKWPLSCFGK